MTSPCGLTYFAVVSLNLFLYFTFLIVEGWGVVLCALVFFCNLRHMLQQVMGSKAWFLHYMQNWWWLSSLYYWMWSPFTVYAPMRDVLGLGCIFCFLPSTRPGIAPLAAVSITFIVLLIFHCMISWGTLWHILTVLVMPVFIYWLNWFKNIFWFCVEVFDLSAVWEFFLRLSFVNKSSWKYFLFVFTELCLQVEVSGWCSQAL